MSEHTALAADEPHHPGARPGLVVAARFNGPTGSGNGGYAAGLLAAGLPARQPIPAPARRGHRRPAPRPGQPGGPAVSVTLRRPPPLETDLQVIGHDDRVALLHGDDLVAEAAVAACTGELVEPVDHGAAQAAAVHYPGRHIHPYPECFVCGTTRAPGDGLRLEPGRLPGRPGVTATAWVPDRSLAAPGMTIGPDAPVAPEFVWAALDCPGGWAADMEHHTLLLGRITARLDEVPRVGDRCVVMGRLLDRQGRKWFTATTLYDEDGRVLAQADAVWIEVVPGRTG